MEKKRQWKICRNIVLLYSMTINNNTNSNSNTVTNINTSASNNTNPKTLRMRYIIAFVIFIIVIILLSIYNPYGLLTSYAGPIIFVSAFLAMFLLTMIVFYDYLFKNPNSMNVPKNLSSNIFFISFAFLLSAGVIVFFMWMMGLFSNKPDTSTTGIGSFIINFMLLFVMISIVYKLFTMTNLTKSPLGRVILYSIFYIPCLFVNIIEMIMKEYHQTTKPMVVLLCIEVVLFALYFLYPIITRSIYTQGGKQLINQPISLDTEHTLATYQTLNDGDEYNYNYALSLWVFIDAMPLNTNANYGKYTNILSYGETPSIRYNPLTNSLVITVSQDAEKPISLVDITHKLEDRMSEASLEQVSTIQKVIKNVISKVKDVPILNEHDDSGKRIIYTKKDVLLQKWNNIILNYSGGTLDIFYNGELVKSAVEVVPYLTYDTLTVGDTKGISGGIANVTYFKSSLDAFKINRLYNSMKDKNPPCLLENDKTII